jgi:hypothetical protein
MSLQCKQGSGKFHRSPNSNLRNREPKKLRDPHTSLTSISFQRALMNSINPSRAVSDGVIQHEGGNG